MKFLMYGDSKFEFIGTSKNNVLPSCSRDLAKKNIRNVDADINNAAPIVWLKGKVNG